MKDVQLGPPIIVGDTTISPLECTQVFYYRSGRGVVAHAQKEPVGIVVETPGHKWAVDLNGQPIPLDQLPLDNRPSGPASNGRMT